MNLLKRIALGGGLGRPRHSGHPLPRRVGGFGYVDWKLILCVSIWILHLNGLGGNGNGRANAIATAEVLNRLHPCIINIVSLTIFPESQLYQEVQDGTYIGEPEIERLMEMRTLIDSLNIRVNLLGHHISNTVPITGALPDDKAAILRELDKAIAQFPEEELRNYRDKIWHLWRFQSCFQPAYFGQASFLRCIMRNYKPSGLFNRISDLSGVTHEDFGLWSPHFKPPIIVKVR